jgi:hypothetical protein
MARIGARTVCELVLGATLGWCVITLPVMMDAARERHDAAFLPLMADVAEDMRPISLIGLFLLGVPLGWLGKAPEWASGFVCVASLPLWSTVDMALGGDHNLLPFEWLIYGFYGVLAYLGVVFGRRKIRRVGGAGTSEHGGA